MSDTREAETIPLSAVRDALKGQYRAGFTMFEEAVELCPDDIWLREEHVNAYWQLAYHALYFTHLYLQPTEADFRPWPGHQGRVQHEDGIAGPPDPDSDLPLIPSPYAKQDVLAYLRYLEARLDGYVDALDLTSSTSGFDWYQTSKLEHQIINVRHLHHHLAQLADRLRNTTGVGVAWVDSHPESN